MYKAKINKVFLRNVFTILVFATLLLTFYLYSVGLLGGFIFDDQSNLKNIASFSLSDGVQGIFKYIMSFNSGILKRPISTLSFLLNSSQWPVEAFSFKLTNLLLHLFNALLLYFVTVKFLSFFELKESKVKLIAYINMTIWVLNPYFVSTTLYVIQRMTMLPVMFSLLGIYFYLASKEILGINRKKGLILLAASAYFCTTLAVLSKENGIILPFLILLIEWVQTSNNCKYKLEKKLKYIFYIIPSIIIVFILFYKIPDFMKGYNIREFSLIERMLTQPRVVFTYIYHLFLPTYLTESVYTDNFVLSQSLFNPITTIISICALFALISFSIYKVKKYYLFSYSFLFFIIALIIESSLIPLELYFEHRSYFPSLFIFLPFSYVISIFIDKTKITYLILLALFIYLGLTLHLRSSLWSNNIKLVNITSNKFPNSTRAFTQKVSYIYGLGKTKLATELLEMYTKRHDELSLKFNLLVIKCEDKLLKIEDIQMLLYSIKKTKITSADRLPLISFFTKLNSSQCIENGLFHYKNIIESIKLNQGIANPMIKNVIDFHDAYYYLKSNEFLKANKLFNKFFIEYSDFNTILYVIQELINKGEIVYANELLLLLVSEDRQLTYYQSDIKVTIRKLMKQNEILLQKL